LASLNDCCGERDPRGDDTMLLNIPCSLFVVVVVI
jgi:hypothetical protein